MPHLTTDDGIKLHYEEVGRGIPIIFVHEFAGDSRSYEMQLRYFGLGPVQFPTGGEAAAFCLLVRLAERFIVI